MLRPFLALNAIAFLSGPLAAATYAAKPSAPPASAQIVARDIAWACAQGTCRGQADSSRPVVQCQALAKKAGRIESFTVNGAEIPAAELERCNASAKTVDNPALADAR